MMQWGPINRVGGCGGCIKTKALACGRPRPARRGHCRGGHMTVSGQTLKNAPVIATLNTLQQSASREVISSHQNTQRIVFSGPWLANPLWPRDGSINRRKHGGQESRRVNYGRGQVTRFLASIHHPRTSSPSVTSS